MVFDDELYHFGVGIDDGAPGRGSGRYAKGSGDHPYQHDIDLLSRIDKYRRDGMDEPEIAAALGLYNTKGKPSTTRLRSQESIAKAELRMFDVDRAKELAAQGMGASEIGRIMGRPESSIRSLLNEDSERRTKAARETANVLKSKVDELGMIDVGAGAERYLNVSRTKFDNAIESLQIQGYELYSGNVPQVTNDGKYTVMKILCPPGTEHKEIYNYGNIHSVQEFNVISHDDGQTYDPKYVYPKSMDSSRLMIRYAEDGGKDKDGLVEIRRNVEDLSLGESRYAQVRILVDDTRYIKGMAVYSDGKDMPPGVDIIFNTNKSKSTPKMEVLKDVSKNLENDPNNPFGSLIKQGVSDPTNPNAPANGGQSYYIDKNGKKQLSLINKRADEGDWGEWSKEIPSQFLSKQKKELAERQLNISRESKKAEFEEIMSLTNPTVKKVLLDSFSKDCDKAAETLKAAALPRQKYQVILPLTSIKDNEIYAPNYSNGEQVALVRFPHGGTFEIPILTVNNKNREGNQVLSKTPADAVGINSKVAERLSGADFDGDTVLVIPTNNGKTKITSKPPLKDLEGFDPKESYPKRDGMTFMKYTNSEGKKIDNTQSEMGKISNLITDMTIKGATDSELARAVRHSMVVIDAGKHELDYKKSEADNHIKELKQKYQGHYVDGRYSEGASTLISRSKAEISVDKRQGEGRINRETGELEYKTSENLTYTDKSGKTKVRKEQSTQMRETKDARTLSAGYPVEELYAKYANDMKAMANKARLASLPENAGRTKYDPKAKETYSTEVESLNKKLGESLKNAPRERQAQYIANCNVQARISDNPHLKENKKELKKYKQMALEDARAQVGAKRTTIDITDREWEAIQAGAISENTLFKILNHTDSDKLKERATPRNNQGLSKAEIARIKNMKAMDYTTDEIAKMMHISASSVSKYVK